MMRHWWICLCVLLATCTDRKNISDVAAQPVSPSKSAFNPHPDYLPGIITLENSLEKKTVLVSASDAKEQMAEDTKFKDKFRLVTSLGLWSLNRRPDSRNLSIAKFALDNSSTDTICLIEVMTTSDTATLYIKLSNDSTYKKLNLNKKKLNIAYYYTVEISLVRFRQHSVILSFAPITANLSSEISFSLKKDPVAHVEPTTPSYSMTFVLVSIGIAMLVFGFLTTKDSIYIAAALYILFYMLSSIQYTDPNININSGYVRIIRFGVLSSFNIILFRIPFKHVKLNLLAVILGSAMAIWAIIPINEFQMFKIASFIVFILYVPFALQKTQSSESHRFSALTGILLASVLPLQILYLQFLTVKAGGAIFELFEIVNFSLIAISVIRRFIFDKRIKQQKNYQLAVSQQKLITEKVIESVEAERERIARDLHDELGGNLALLKLKLESINSNGEALNTVNKIVNQTTESLRNISHELMPPYFAKTGLLEVLSQHFETLKLKNETKFKLVIAGESFRMESKQELMIYRIVMELIQNCLKHSSANEVTLELNFYPERINIICEDDGIGFDPQIKDGLGLRNMHSRVQYLNGNMNIDSNASGTTIIINIPVNPSL